MFPAAECIYYGYISPFFPMKKWLTTITAKGNSKPIIGVALFPAEIAPLLARYSRNQSVKGIGLPSSHSGWDGSLSLTGERKAVNVLDYVKTTQFNCRALRMTAGC